MTTATLTLTEFLLARIAEDEATAQTGRNEYWRVEGGPSWTDDRPYELVGGGKHLATFDDDHGILPSIHIGRWSPARVLAECEAKRRIVEGMQPYCPIDDISAPEVLGYLATPYADHPDYREEWRP